jgi:hypothetical protein
MSILLQYENQYVTLFTVTGIDNNNLPWSVIVDMKKSEKGMEYLLTDKAIM